LFFAAALSFGAARGQQQGGWSIGCDGFTGIVFDFQVNRLVRTSSF